MLAAIPLTDDERAAVDDGRTAVETLLAWLADVPTPAGPTPHQIGVPPTVTLLPIVQVTSVTSDEGLTNLIPHNGHGDRLPHQGPMPRSVS
jgi:hypothetical protein